MGEKTHPTIKVLESTQTKFWRLNIKAARKMDDCFTICQYKKKEPTNIRISTPILQRFDCFGIKHAFFLISKMAVLETYNKKHGIKNVFVLSRDTSISQMHHRSNHLNWSERKNENLQSSEKISVNAYLFLRTCLFPSFSYLNTMVLL